MAARSPTSQASDTPSACCVTYTMDGLGFSYVTGVTGVTIELLGVTCRPVTCVTPVTPRFDVCRKSSRTLATASLIVFLRHDNRRLQYINPHRATVDLPDTLKTVRCSFQHSAFSKCTRNHYGGES